MCFNREITLSIPHLTHWLISNGMPPDPARSSLVQTHIASIWGSQTWGLCIYKDVGCILSDLQKVFTCHYRPNHDLNGPFWTTQYE